ncbi:MAG TPA: pyridoxal phosphate-dependent aminotransferase [Spirochaetia bacterium]|nr:pyridoxal phosphate-dependent aminotransferase [Spirochaetia bacterium]
MEQRQLTLSSRGGEVPLSPIRKLTPLADEAKKRGIEVFHLNIGQPDIKTPRPVIDAYRSFNADVLAYSPSLGIPQLRQSIAGYYQRYGHDVSPHEVAVTVGGSEAIFFALSAVCDPGDEILVREPFYANYIAFAAMISAKVVPIPSSLDAGYALPSREEIARFITPRTKAILYISPENPTGIIYDPHEMETLRELCERFGLYLIADEVYREFIYDEHAQFSSILGLEGFEQHAILIDSVSKRFSSCGARVGCIVSYNTGVMELVDKFAQARLCPPTVGQLAADAAYRMDPSYFVPIKEEYRRRRDALVTGLRRIPGVEFNVPDGAFYLMARLPVSDAEDFCRFLLADFSLNKKTVMLTPGAGFYSSPDRGRDEVRIAYVLEQGKIEESVEILSKALEQYRAALSG